MDLSEFEKYLFQSIPSASALGIKVKVLEASHASISAPIELNKNHLNTVFGGSSSMVCILTAWSLFQNRIISSQLDGKLMIRQQEVSYYKPITDDFVCDAYFNEDLDWDSFINAFEKKNKARLEIKANIYQEEKLAVEFKGVFVLLRS